MPRMVSAAAVNFNSRPSARGDAAQEQARKGYLFQFTPLREGRRPTESVVYLPNVFQFTPLREGRRNQLCFLLLRVIISIHAPPRGATAKLDSIAGGVDISIHAPPRGATMAGNATFAACKISIHAPPRGATIRFWVPSLAMLFQFTPLREGRPPLPGRFAETANFNSRPSARGDSSDGIRGMTKPFQFTPLREGRRGVISPLSSCVLFQFTPLREGRQQKICNFCKSFVQPLQISMA